MTRYFYDTEFIEDGETIGLISIGIVADDGREYYAVNSDMPYERIAKHDFLCKKVVPHLPLRNKEVDEKVEEWIQESRYFNGYSPYTTLEFRLDTTDTVVKPKWVIANEVRDFLLAGTESIELWADHAAYDHVALCQLWGPMIDLPKGVPMFTNDVQQEIRKQPGDQTPSEQNGTAHNALDDARHVKLLWEWLDTK